jgi:HEAT repeat protein
MPPMPMENPGLAGAQVTLQDRDDAVRLATLAGLLKPGVETSEVLGEVEACIDSSSENVRRVAVLVLGHLQPPAVPALARALDERHPISVRVCGASELGRAGADAGPAIDQLSKCLTAPDDLLRWHAAFALGKIGSAAVPSLKLMLRSPDPLVVSAAMDAAGWIGPGAKMALEDVRRLAASPVPAVRLACHSAMVKITGDVSMGLPMLLAALEDRDASVRAAALERIGHLRALARESAPSILRCMADQSREVRAAAALALARVEASTPQAVAALTRSLADPEPDVRANAGIALASFGPAATSALPALRLMQHTTEPRLAAIAKAAVERIEGPARP